MMRSNILAAAIVLGAGFASGAASAADTPKQQAQAMAAAGKLSLDEAGKSGYHVLVDANVRAQPSPDSKIVGWMSKNSNVTILGRVPVTGWYALVSEGSLAFMSGALIAPAGSSQPLAAPAALTAAAMKAASEGKAADNVPMPAEAPPLPNAAAAATPAPGAKPAASVTPVDETMCPVVVGKK